VHRGSLRLGLTGGIGSGKSTVAGQLRQFGATIIDADEVSRRITGPNGLALPAIKATFGHDFVNPGSGLDREKMRTLVFQQPSARQALEAIVHPLVGSELRLKLEEALANHAKLIVLDIPLLLEANHWRQVLDHILVVDCTHDTQMQRVKERNNLTEQIISAMILAQASRTHRASGADSIIYNDNISLDELAVQTREIAREFGL
jgi:dephospho-CoA kinase